MECDYRHCEDHGKERVIVSNRQNYFTCLCTWHFQYLKYECKEAIFDIEETTIEEEVISMPLVKTGVKRKNEKADELTAHIKQHVKTASKKVEDEQPNDQKTSRTKDTGRD